jgi:hypothetical protein
MLSLRAHALISGAILGCLIALPLALAALQSAGVVKNPAAMETPVKIGIFVIFLAFGFSAIPLMLKLFLAGQRLIGNGELAPIKALAAHQTGIVIGAWLFISLGLLIAIPAAVEDGFFGAAATKSVNAFLRGKSQGVLVAGPGMSVEEMFRRSTLAVNDGGMKRRDLPVYAASAVFDFQIAGTDTILHGCRYYYISTYTRDPSKIQGVNIGTSPDKLTRAELVSANAALRAQLAAEGWRTGHEVYRTPEDQTLHGGETRGEDGWVWLKDDTILDLEMKRLDDPKPNEDAATAGEWIQFIDLRERSDYAGIERYEFAPANP